MELYIYIGTCSEVFEVALYVKKSKSEVRVITNQKSAILVTVKRDDLFSLIFEARFSTQTSCNLISHVYGSGISLVLKTDRNEEQTELLIL